MKTESVILTLLAGGVALGSSSFNQSRPWSGSSKNHPFNERLGSDPCPIIEGAWGSPRPLTGTCSNLFTLLRAWVSAYVPDAGKPLGVYSESEFTLIEETGEYEYSNRIFTIDLQEVLPWFEPPYPGGNTQIYSAVGYLADVDGDGLADLIASFESEDKDGWWYETPLLWFKNLGYPVPGQEDASPRLLGDLNGDCEVSGADMGILLTEYGNTCD